jgi:hypothetical protein
MYEGAQGVDIPEVSAWRIAGYGGMQFSDPDRLGETCSVFGALTGPEPPAKSNDQQPDEQRPNEERTALSSVPD